MIPQGHRLAAFLALIALVLPTVAGACDRREPTRATGPGPHDFSQAAGEPRLWRDGDPGEPLSLRIRVIDTCGEPLSGTLVRVLHADENGMHHPHRYRAHLFTNERGELRLTTVFPGFTGGIARHIHFVISHPGHPDLETRLFFRNDPDIVGEGIEDLAMTLEEVHDGDRRRWLAGFEFVLAGGG